MLTVDFSKHTGKIKPMHAVGAPPLVGVRTDYFKYFQSYCSRQQLFVHAVPSVTPTLKTVR